MAEDSSKPGDRDATPDPDDPVRPLSEPDSTDGSWAAKSATGEAEFVEPPAERTDAERPFTSSEDSPLESDINQRVSDQD
jgi:hypothetical protein